MNFPDINIDAFPLLLCSLFAHSGQSITSVDSMGNVYINIHRYVYLSKNDLTALENCSG